LGKIISSFVLLLGNIRRLFIGIDPSGFKLSKLPNILQIKIHNKKYLKPDELPGKELGEGSFPWILIVKSDGCLL